MIERRASPVRDLHRMHSKLRPQLVERPFAADLFDRYPRLELWRVLLPRRRHRFSFATADSEINLFRGVKTGVHYKCPIKEDVHITELMPRAVQRLTRLRA